MVAILISERNNFNNSKSPCCSDAFHRVSAQSDTVREQITTEDFQDGHRGGHLGHHNKIILASLNFLVAQMLPTKFWLNPTCHSGADVVWRFSWRLSLKSEQNDFSNSESLCRSDTFHQVSAQSNYRFWKISRWPPWRNETILAISNLYVSPMPSTEYHLNPTCRSGADVVWRFSRWLPWRSSWITEQNDSAILTLYVAPMPPVGFRFNPNLIFQEFQDGHFGYRNETTLTILYLRIAPIPSTVAERNDFSNSKSSCPPNASHQISHIFAFFSVFFAFKGTSLLRIFMALEMWNNRRN